MRDPLQLNQTKHALIVKLTAMAVALSVLVALVFSVLGEREVGKSPASLAVEADLVLQAALRSPVTISPGEPVSISLRITNRSAELTRKVIKIGDGSEAGLREPHVFFKAEWQAADGAWLDVPRREYVRDCGLFDSNWVEDAVGLAPGESLAFDKWVPNVNGWFDFEKKGNYRIYANYRYGIDFNGGERTYAQRLKLDEKVRGIPNFTLTSTPVSLSVE